MNFKDVLEIGDSKEEKDRLDGCGGTAGRRKIAEVGKLEED